MSVDSTTPDIYQVTLASIGDAVIATDLDANITFLNHVAERLTGWPLAEATGRPLSDVFRIVNESTREPVPDPAQRALAEGHVVGLANHTVLIARDGREYPIDDSAAPIADAAGRVAGAVLVFRDITERKRAERERAVLAAIVASSDDAIVSKTLDGVITSWNTGAERIFGYRADEAIGQHITMIIPPELHGEEAEIIARIRRGERVDHFETVRVTKDGQRLDISLTVSPVRDGSGRVVGASKVARDVTERRRAEEAIREQHQTIEALYSVTSKLAAELDVGKLLQAVTDEATALAGAAYGAFFYNAIDERDGSYLLYSLAGAPKEAFAGFPHPRATAIFEPTFQGRGTVRLDDVTRDPRFGRNAPYNGMPAGHLPVRSYLAVPVKSRSGEVLGGLFFGHPEPGVFRERHEKLVVGVASQAAVAIDNAKLYERLRDTDRRKDEFLATLAHELRNPLAPVRTGVQVLKAGPASADAAETLAMMERQAGHLAHLVDDLMDVARVTSGKIKLRKERLDLRAVVNSAIEATRPAVQSGSHALELKLPGEPLAVDGDPTRMVQVLTNLLTNAAKYTEPGGRIEVAATRAGDEAVVTVADNGVGIPADMLPVVFDMFSQVGTSLERSQGGLGIGLTLVRKLVEMHGGTVSVTSAGADRGSTFTVQMPLAPGGMGDAARVDGTRSEAATAIPLKVLIVDDNKDGAASLALFLKLSGHTSRTAHSGPDGLHAANEFRPDVILLDIGLPGMNGFDVARALRADAAFRDTTIVALTGWGSEDDRRKSKEAGCDDHLTKPVDADEVKRVLAAVRKR